MSGLDCENCGCKLRLMHGDKFMKLKSGEKIAFANVPLLMCGGCQKRYIPYQTKEMLDAFQQMLEDTEKPHRSIDVVEKEEDKKEFSAEETETWYDFQKIKNMFCNDKFIAEKVKFLYDRDDYYFIPGLVRPWKIGFLTPVFFNIEVLLKYIHHPQYGLDIGADTFGYIYKGDEHYISFGINENKYYI